MLTITWHKHPVTRKTITSMSWDGPREIPLAGLTSEDAREMALYALHDGFEHAALARRGDLAVLAAAPALPGDEMIAWRGMGDEPLGAAGWDPAGLGGYERREMIAEYAQERLTGKWDERRGYAVLPAGFPLSRRTYLPPATGVHETIGAAHAEGGIVAEVRGRRITGLA